MNAQQAQAIRIMAELVIATLPMTAPERDCTMRVEFKAGDEVTGKYRDGKLVSISHWDETDQLSTIRYHKGRWLVKAHGVTLVEFDGNVEMKRWLFNNFLILIAGRFGL